MLHEVNDGNNFYKYVLTCKLCGAQIESTGGSNDLCQYHHVCTGCGRVTYEDKQYPYTRYYAPE